MLKAELDKGDYIIPHKSFKNNKRLNCLWNKLKSTESSLYCDLIMDFETNSKIHIQLGIDNKPNSTTYAQTSTSGINQIDIVFNEANLNMACDIKIISTMLHEGIHALIFKIYLQSISASKNVDMYLPGYSEYYNKYKEPKDPDHEYMAAKMIDRLIQGLKDIYSNKYTDAEYEAIVWEGLSHTDAYKSLPSDMKQSMTNIRNNLNQSCEKTCF